MKKTNILFWAGIILLAIFSLAQADHRIIAGTWCGDAGTGQDNLFWNDLCLNDSICRTELQVDTIVNLFYDCTYYGTINKKVKGSVHNQLDFLCWSCYSLK